MENSRIKLSDLSPSDYFNLVKEKKNTIDDQALQQIYDNCLTLLNKYRITGQTKAVKKLIFHLECIEKEHEIIKSGINTFVYRDDIEEFIESVSKDVVKIIELENYEREIPDDIVTLVGNVKDKFDKFYVVFTDYTGKVERQVTKERQDKDPILFGTLQDKETDTVIDRFYYIGDWEDEYCDLTLDKMVNAVKTNKNKNIVMTIQTPQDIQELKEQLRTIDERQGRFRVLTKENMVKKSFFDTVKSFFRKKT